MESGHALVHSPEGLEVTSARRTLSTRSRAVILYAVLSSISFAFLFPFLWTVTSSLKQIWELFAFPPTIFPQIPQWQNYTTVLTVVPFLLWIKNSLLVVSASTIGIVLSSSIVAYSFARFSYRGRNLVFMITLGTIMLPPQITLIPQFVLFDKIGWVNTLRPLWVPSWFGGGAFFIFLLRQFMLSLPASLDEAALIDGAGLFRIYWSILLPLCKPALATVAVLSFIGSWGDFLTPLIYLNNPSKFTVALGLNFFQNVPQTSGMPMQNLLMAASVMATLPPVLLFFVAQRYFVEGIVLSGTKG